MDNGINYFVISIIMIEDRKIVKTFKEKICKQLFKYMKLQGGHGQHSTLVLI